MSLFAASLIAWQKLYFQVELEPADRSALEERVSAFWRARLTGEAAATHRYLGGAIAEQYSAEEWSAREGQVDYLDYEVLSIESERLGRAGVHVKYHWRLKAEIFADEAPRETTADEYWELSDEWLRVGVN
ncbi:MAG: hypothetical protein RL885_13570 [Planctomycetota bacterium]